MTVDCRRCFKAIRIEEWAAHLDWHREADEAVPVLGIVHPEPEPIVA